MNNTWGIQEECCRCGGADDVWWHRMVITCFHYLMHLNQGQSRAGADFSPHQCNSRWTDWWLQGSQLKLTDQEDILLGWCWCRDGLSFGQDCQNVLAWRFNGFQARVWVRFMHGWSGSFLRYCSFAVWSQFLNLQSSLYTHLEPGQQYWHIQTQQNSITASGGLKALYEMTFGSVFFLNSGGSSPWNSHGCTWLLLPHLRPRPYSQRRRHFLQISGNVTNSSILPIPW